MKWALASLLISAGTAQADPCPISDQSKMWGKFRHLSHMLVAVTYRKECGVADHTDLRAIRSLHEAQGCSADTELGQYFTDRVSAKLNEDTGHPGVQMLRTTAPLAYYRFCKMAEILPWPKQTAAFLLQRPGAVPTKNLNEYQIFWAHLDAMQGELTRMMTEATN